MLKVNNFCKTIYYSNYDLIHKYTLKSLHDVPKIVKLNCCIRLDNTSISHGMNHTDLKLQYQIFYIFYCLILKVPYIRLYKTDLVRGSQLSYSISFKINNLKEVLDFLCLLFIDHVVSTDIDNITKFSNIEKNKLPFIMSVKTSVSAIASLDKFVMIHFNDLNLREIPLVFFLKCQGSNIFVNKNLLIKNLPFLWIND